MRGHGSSGRRSRRVAAGLLAPLALVLALTGCTAAAVDQAGGVSGAAGGDTTVVVAYSNAINTLDPQHADYAMTNNVISAVYDTLVSYDDDGNLVGVLASQFSLSADASAVDVTLEPGVTFHDGNPVTAGDVKFSLDRYRAIGQGIAGLLAGYDSTTVVDDAHLTITLTGSNSTFLSALSKAYIMEAALVTDHAGTDQGQAWLQANDAGSGPYRLTGSPVSGDIQIDRYDRYRAFDPARPTRMVFRRIDQSATERPS